MAILCVLMGATVVCLRTIFHRPLPMNVRSACPDVPNVSNDTSPSTSPLLLPRSAFPPVLHVTVRNGQTFTYGAKWVALNPGWTVRVWDDQKMEAFVQQLGDTVVLNTHSRLKGAKLSDYFRLLVLEMIGGVYADSDVEPLGSLDQYIATLTPGLHIAEEPDLHKVALYATPVNEHIACNFFMIATPHDASVRAIREAIERMDDAALHKADATATTGPKLIDSRLSTLHSLHWLPSALFSSSVTCYNPGIHVFCGAQREPNGEHRELCCRQSCIRERLNYNCVQGVGGGNNRALVWHHWKHSWISDSFKRAR